MKLLNIILTLALASSFSFTGLSQDFKSANFGRPGQTVGYPIVNQYELLIEHSSKYTSATNVQIINQSNSYRFGLSERFEIQFTETQKHIQTKSFKDQIGLTDLGFGFKYKILDMEKNAPKISVAAFYNSPLRSRDFSDNSNVSVNVIASQAIQDFTLTMNVVPTYHFELEYFTNFTFNTNYRINKRVSFYGEYFYSYENHNLGVGGNYRVGKNMQLDLTLGVQDLKSPMLFANAGFSIQI